MVASNQRWLPCSDEFADLLCPQSGIAVISDAHMAMECTHCVLTGNADPSANDIV